jgi:hypothetical protein
VVRRWLLIALGVAFVMLCVQRLHWAYGVVTARSARVEATPGEDAFKAANRAIIRFRGKNGLGNTPAAEGLAVRLARGFQQAREVEFSEGNKDAFSISGHQFVAYCRLNRDSCVFLVHVPELRRFTDEARTALADRAWIVAHELVQEARLPADARLVVGMKGTVNYEAIYIGGIGNQSEPLQDVKQQDRGFDLNKVRILHPFFADAESTVDLDRAASQYTGPLPPVAPPASKASGYRDYRGLLGEDFQGNVFVIQTYGRRWAVMSRHQFDEGVIPEIAVDPAMNTRIALKPEAVIRQRDVQIISVADQSAPLPYLDFDPLFELEVGDKLWIERGSGNQGTEGTLLAAGLSHGRYSPLNGGAMLSMKLDVPTDVRGASGLPVIRLKTGLPVGVLLTADQGQEASRISFEPICMAGKLPGPVYTDLDISRRMIGAWREDILRDGAASVAQTLFEEDGRFSCAFTDFLPKTNERLWVKGRWRIESGKLIYSDLTSNDPDYPVKVYTDRIIELLDDHLIYANGELPDLQLMRKINVTVPIVSP